MRRRLTIRTLMIAVAVLAFGLWWFVERPARFRRIADEHLAVLANLPFRLILGAPRTGTGPHRPTGLFYGPVKWHSAMAG